MLSVVLIFVSASELVCGVLKQSETNNLLYAIDQ